jgi:hypothetical protein
MNTDKMRIEPQNHQPTILPLPAGEGRGEGGKLRGEQLGNFIPVKLGHWLKPTAIVE